MLLVRMCRNCKKYKIISNDNTFKDRQLLENYKKANLICECEE